MRKLEAMADSGEKEKREEREALGATGGEGESRHVKFHTKRAFY